MSSPHILVVEDDTYVRRLIDEALQSEGYRVTTVADGAEALAALDSSLPAYSLVITDLSLPEVDGQTLLSTYREGGGTTPIVCITGSTHTVADVIALGAAEVLMKPFDLAELFAIVARLAGATPTNPTES